MSEDKAGRFEQEVTEETEEKLSGKS